MAMNNAHVNDTFAEPLYQKKHGHPFRPDVQGRVDGVYDIIALPLPFDGAYPTGALSWSQFNKKYKYASNFQALFQLFSHALEYQDFGTPIFKGRQGTIGRTNSQMAFIRHLEGRPNHKKDKYLLAMNRDGQGIKYTPHFDRAHARAFEAIRTGAMNSEIGRGARGDEDDEAAPMYQAPEEDEDDDEDEDGENREDAIDQRIRNVLLDLLDDNEGRDMDEKIKVVITRMTRPDENDDEENAGCVVFLCIMDPLYSIGHVSQKMLEDCEKHYAMSCGMIVKKRGRGSDISPLVEKFPWIMDDKDNVMHNMGFRRWLEIIAWVRNDMSMLLPESRFRTMTDLKSKRDGNPLNPVISLSIEWAMEVMRKFGVPVDQANIARFCGDEYNLPGVDDGRETTYYFPPNDSYHYQMETWIWNRNGVAALSKQYFPWVEVHESLRAFSAVDASALIVYEENDKYALATDFENAMLENGIGVLRPLPFAPYDPNAFYRHNALFQVSRENARVMSTVTGPPERHGFESEYEAHCHLMSEMRKACFMRVKQVLTPDAQISPPMKIILEWATSNMRKVSTYLPQYGLDVEDQIPQVAPMDAFANYMIRDALLVKHWRHIAQEVRHWLMTHYGTQDCYSCNESVDVHYGSIYRGLSQSGKSYFARDATVKTFIEGTVSEMLESSNRAFNTHEDFLRYVIFKDELDTIYVDARAAEADKTGRAERIKSMMTEQKATYRVLVFVEAANGRSKRLPEDIETLYHATMVACTNKKVDTGDEAIASRFLNFVISRADCDLHEFLGMKEELDEQDEEVKKDAVHMWRVKQCLIAFASVLIDAVVLPEPSMDVYDALNSRMLKYLSKQGINTDAIRSTSITRRLARIYVIINAILLVFDAPGAIHFGKEFMLEMMVDLIPHLYCTKQIALFAITQTGEIFVDPVRRIVLEAARKSAEIQMNSDDTAQTLFKKDHSAKMPWRLEGDDDGDQEVDFNYFYLNGHFKDKIYPAIADATGKKLGPKEVETEINKLKGQLISVKKYKKLSRNFYNTLSRENRRAYILVQDDHYSKIPVVQMDYKNNQLFIAVEALHRYTENILVEAFCHCIHDNFRPQEFILGTQLTAPDHDCSVLGAGHDCTKRVYTGIFNTLVVDDDVIDHYSMGPTFNRPNAAVVQPTARVIALQNTLNPDKEGYYENFNKRRRTAVHTIEKDLDDWGCKRHHYRVYMPGDANRSKSTQTAIYNRMRVNIGNDPVIRTRVNDLLVDYPAALKEEVDRTYKSQNQARSFEGDASYRKKRHRQRIDEWQRNGSQGDAPMMLDISQKMGRSRPRRRVSKAQTAIARLGEDEDLNPYRDSPLLDFNSPWTQESPRLLDQDLTMSGENTLAMLMGSNPIFTDEASRDALVVAEDLMDY
jgi:hypothetical protein